MPYRPDHCAGEVQACADAASERVQALEAQLDAQSAEAETAAAAAQAELESAHADAAAALIAVRAELKASLDAAETELASTKVPCFFMYESQQPKEAANTDISRLAGMLGMTPAFWLHTCSVVTARNLAVP